MRKLAAFAMFRDGDVLSGLDILEDTNATLKNQADSKFVRINGGFPDIV